MCKIIIINNYPQYKHTPTHTNLMLDIKELIHCHSTELFEAVNLGKYKTVL